ncbi:unnamed protein product [Albugo candida]|uniref:Uncharacterized protein n=1 Tax=Albugo candida TaxID=65357 RepID=A0A024GS29_9STRA|nr:unnamed protein product [Albugo candida]|eukprot:CCI49512.1 unnamed protein product [Albugo candida]
MTSANRIVHCHVLVRQRSHDEKVETSTLPLGTYLRILRMLLTSSHSPISSHIQKHVPVTLSVTVIKQKMMRRRVLVSYRQNRQGREKSLGGKRSKFKFSLFRTAPEGKKQREQERVVRKERRIVWRGNKIAKNQSDRDRRKQRLKDNRIAGTFTPRASKRNPDMEYEVMRREAIHRGNIVGSKDFLASPRAPPLSI